MRKKTFSKSTAIKQEYNKILILRTLGNFLILSSLFFIIKTFAIPLKEEFNYELRRYFQKTYVVQEDPDKQPPTPKGLLAQTLTSKKADLLVPTDTNFSVVIPKIGANAVVLPNVNPANEEEYLGQLQKGVAHAMGSAFPGEEGHIYLFAHSTDYFWNIGSYNAVFYLLYKLQKGDEINVFYNGHRNIYNVVGTQIIDPSQVEYLTRKTNQEFLTLQTCWPPGTTLKRLLVFATKVKK